MYQIFSMKKCLANFLLLSVLFYGIVLNAAAIDIYVSPKGNDANPGTKQLPVASIKKVKAMAYDTFERGSNKSVTVWLSGGNLSHF